MSEAQRVVRGLANEFRHASDAKLLKITDMIDQLPERGNADALLDPIRDRLATLRPARPLTRSRLLFMPFDTVLVSPARWRADHATLPRSVLTPVLELLGWERHFGRETIPEAGTGEAALLRLAAPIWRDAGSRLMTADCPAAWRDPAWQQRSGLALDVIRPMLKAMALLLVNAETIRILSHQSPPDTADRIATLLAAAAMSGPAAWGLMLAVLLNGPAPDEVTRIAAAVIRARGAEAQLGPGLNRAIGAMLDRIEDSPVDSGSLSGQIGLIQRAEALGKLEGRPPEEQRRLYRLRTDLMRANRDLFGRSVDSSVSGVGEATAGGSRPISDEALNAIEAELRQLREFAIAASRLGDAAEYERMLEDAARRFGRPDEAGGLDPVERLRLMELLVGGTKAMQTCELC